MPNQQLHDPIPPEKALEYCYNELHNKTIRIQNSTTLVKTMMETIPENREAVDNAILILEGHIKSLHSLLENMAGYIDEYKSE